MNTHSTHQTCLKAEELHDAASGHELSPGVAAHLLTCAACQEQVAGLREALDGPRARFDATVDAAVSSFRMPPLPARSPQRAGAWRLFATPIPAYAVMALLLLIALPLGLKNRGGQEYAGGIKAVSMGTSSQELFKALYAPNLKDPLAVLATVDLIEPYAASHPDDLSAHVKLVQLYTVLLDSKGWEDASHTRELAQRRLTQERAKVAHGLSRLSVSQRGR